MRMGIFLSLLVIGCSNKKAVEDITLLKLGHETITAGNYFRLTPVKDEPITLSGKDFSANDFVFHCILLSKETDIEYQGAVTFQASSSSGRTVTETQSVKEFDRWPSGVTQKDITIHFSFLPLMYTYSGHGFLYLYLVDKHNHCISNIVRWKVNFV